jgi:electron transport complex protein RnfG
MKNSYIGQAWLVLVLALSFGGALAGVEAALRDRIAGNKLADAIDQVPILVPGADKRQSRQANAAPLVETIAKGGKKTTYQVFRAFDAGGKQIGWVVRAGGLGFADIVDVLVGLDARCEKITGLYVLDQKETPGLGNKIMGDDWRRQYAGKSTSAVLTVVKAKATAPEQIQAISGATISSDAVTGLVNQVVADLREPLRNKVK